MTNRIEAGTIIAGTLRSGDLLEAFSSELETLVKLKQVGLRLLGPLGIPSTYREWTRINIHKSLIYEARTIEPDSEIASEVVNDLQDALNEYAPDGMYFGSLEGDGADFGWWYVDVE